MFEAHAAPTGACSRIRGRVIVDRSHRPDRPCRGSSSWSSAPWWWSSARWWVGRCRCRRARSVRGTVVQGPRVVVATVGDCRRDRRRGRNGRGRARRRRGGGRHRRRAVGTVERRVGDDGQAEDVLRSPRPRPRPPVGLGPARPVGLGRRDRRELTELAEAAGVHRGREPDRARLRAPHPRSAPPGHSNSGTGARTWYVTAG